MGQNLTGIVFQPPPPSYDRNPRLIELKTDRGQKIPAYFLRKRGAHFTLLFSHGNAEDLGLILGYFLDMADLLNCNFFLYEYTGYGISTGTAEEACVYSDIMAAYNYMRDVLKIDWTRIIAYGRSLGTAPSVFLATQTPIRGIVLQSPMLSIYRVPFHFRFTMPGDILCNIDRIRNVECPVLVMHGTKDELVPCWHGHKLYEICKERGLYCDEYIVDGADHNSFEIFAGDAFYDRLGKFLAALKDQPLSPGLMAQAQRCQVPATPPVNNQGSIAADWGVRTQDTAVSMGGRGGQGTAPSPPPVQEPMPSMAAL